MRGYPRFGLRSGVAPGGYNTTIQRNTVRAPRQEAFRHSLPVRPAAGAGVRIQSTTNGEHQESVLESETGPTHAPAPVAPARAAPHCRLALVLHRHATDRAREHESGSTPRIQGDGLIPAAAATDLRPENDLRRADVPGRPSYRDRSPIFAVPLKILHQIAQRHDWLARRWLTASEQRGCQPPLTDRLGQPCVCQNRTAARLWRYDFRHDAIAVRD